MSNNNQPKKSVLFQLLKGFIYGNVVGLFSGSALFMLASAVDKITQGLPITPALFFALIYGASVVSGVAHEYSDWLEAQ
jgi:Na+/H+-dicarboxylate symporter